MKKMRWSGAVLALGLVSACSADASQSGDGIPGSSEGPQEAGVNSEGDCVAIGHGNEQDCTIVNLPAEVDEFGGIGLGWSMAQVYFDGSIEEVPDPPDYPLVLPGQEEGEWSAEDGPPASVMNHCSFWEEWFQGNEKIYRSQPQITASLWGGAEELVAITGVTAQVFERPEPSPSGVTLTCVYGAGDNYGASIVVDTETTMTTLTNFEDEEKSGEMPPASLSMNDPSGSPTLSAMIAINSPRYLYSGMLTVDGRVGDENPYIHVGTPSEPIRWIGSLGNELSEAAPRYGWNVETQEWVKDFYPGMLESVEWY